MNKKTLFIIIGIIIVIGLYLGGKYNSMLTEKTTVDQTWAQVENNYQSRFDLVPNLQSIVSGAANFEKSTFTEVTEARTKWMSASSRNEKINAASSFDSSLARLLVTFENYPTLKATENFKTFQAQLEGIENRIRVARKDYNDQVKVYNVTVQTFPNVIFARILGFTPEEFFKSEPTAEKAPKIDFSK